MNDSVDLKVGPCHDLAIPILDIYPNKVKTAYERVMCTLMIIACQFTVAKIKRDTESTQVFINR